MKSSHTVARTLLLIAASVLVLGFAIQWTLNGASTKFRTGEPTTVVTVPKFMNFMSEDGRSVKATGLIPSDVSRLDPVADQERLAKILIYQIGLMEGMNAARIYDQEVLSRDDFVRNCTLRRMDLFQFPQR